MVCIFFKNFLKKNKGAKITIVTDNITSIIKISPPNIHKTLLHSQSDNILKDQKKTS